MSGTGSTGCAADAAVRSAEIGRVAALPKTVNQLERGKTLEALAARMRELAQKVEALENTPWLHPKDVYSALGISKATFYRRLKDGSLPRPTYIYGPVWRRCDLDRAKRRKARRTRPDKADKPCRTAERTAGRTDLSGVRPSVRTKTP